MFKSKINTSTIDGEPREVKTYINYKLKREDGKVRNGKSVKVYFKNKEGAFIKYGILKYGWIDKKYLECFKIDYIEKEMSKYKRTKEKKKIGVK